jgi:hypothetical protein
VTGLPLRVLWRWCRYEVFISYGPDTGARNDWLGMFLTRRGAERAMAQAEPDRREPDAPYVVLLGLPRGDYLEKPVLAVTEL